MPLRGRLASQFRAAGRRPPVHGRAVAEQNVPVELDSFTFVLLRRPHDAPDYPEAELAELQAGHLANLARLGEQGLLVLAGPFSDQADESLRGFGIFRSGLAETRSLMADDPAVRAGRLVADVMTWSTPAGSLPETRSRTSG